MLNIILQKIPRHHGKITVMLHKRVQYEFSFRADEVSKRHVSKIATKY